MMRLLTKRYDGGDKSGVSGYWVIEVKSLFSIVLLKFNPNNRENFHSHAFNALTLWLAGEVVEERIDLKTKEKTYLTFSKFMAKFTPKNNVHKVHCTKPAWALCFRGPWDSTWLEYNEAKEEVITLTHGRKIVEAK